jgi:hypothetical protein
MRTARSQPLIRQLLAHVAAHPGASDTAEGIARWWLNPKEWVDMHELTAALDVLVARGVMAEQHAADGRCRYRRIGTAQQIAVLRAELESADGLGG